MESEEADLNPHKDKFITSDINDPQEDVDVIGSRFKISIPAGQTGCKNPFNAHRV